MKLFVLVLTITGFLVSSLALAGGAPGDDPNARIDSNKNQSGTLAEGGDMNAQVSVCKSCEKKNVLLSDRKHIAQPGVSSSETNKPTSGAKGTR